MRLPTILIWERDGGVLAAHWEPTRSAPFDVKWGSTPAEAIGRLTSLKGYL